MVFYHYSWDRGSLSLNTKYLAYIALLAGWLAFCYWLYAKEIYPRFHRPMEMSGLVFEKNIDAPLAYAWGSETPHAGEPFRAWADSLRMHDSLKNILVFRSFYFRDETSSLASGKQLALSRANILIEYLGLSKDRILIEAVPANVKSDVRSKLFNALQPEVFDNQDVLKAGEDTIEICFPLKDSFLLPEYLKHQVEYWTRSKQRDDETKVHMIGTADGTGIAEAADMGYERALAVHEVIKVKGWRKDQIIISTGQRNNEKAIRNRCVVIFLEK